MNMDSTKRRRQKKRIFLDEVWGVQNNCVSKKNGDILAFIYKWDSEVKI